jgi:hypothetical protein
MYARLWAATFCCALTCLPVVGADSSGLAEGEVVVHLTGITPNPATSAAMRQETGALLKSAGYTLSWDGHESPDANLVVLEFAGDCSAPSAPAPTATTVHRGDSLATTTVQDGVVLPFARIDCAAVQGTLGPLLAHEAPARRSYFYGRAIGRLIAHELYHVLAQTRDHAVSGIGKPCFSAADLVSDRFEFETVALDRLRHTSIDTSAPSSDFSGRQ